MIDLHTHTLLSDGTLLPTELVRRYKVLGAKAVALTDHVDHSNIDAVIKGLVSVSRKLNKEMRGISVIPGCELTHVPPAGFAELVKKARKLGARIVLAHGETPVEPVVSGTNKAAILAGVDILTHPGLISKKDASLAKEKDVVLEISARAGHSLTNGHVAKIANEAGADIIFSTDAHGPSDLADKDCLYKVLKGSGLDGSGAEAALKTAKKLVKKLS